jgi:hypothetical protein
MTRRYQLNAFGLDIEADFELPGALPCTGPRLERDLWLRRVPWDEVQPAAETPATLRYLHIFDGAPYVMLEGVAGEMLVRYGQRALFLLSADRRILQCAPTAADEPTWQRVLLDTVLWTVSLLQGFELLHASAVKTEDGIVAFVAVSGGGKTSLAAEYVRRGAPLFCDDILALDQSNGRVIGFPGPPLMNLPRQLNPNALAGGRVIADFGEERWVRVNGSSPSPEPLTAVVLVDRAVGLEAACSAIQTTSLALLPHAVWLPHLADRMQKRFELFGAVASTTQVLRLTADPSVPAGQLADLVKNEIASH